ncbi:MAG: recombination protein RecR [Chloroflexi bacterium]|nr:MAG: recombination protein RecR [Chloroflexota bacterium]TME40362.1 MAG: recombination protein RecR [Chloroflexota bacterium]TME54953.1 MAG: recombination protein RecR [Chloroflexota bacterium]
MPQLPEPLERLIQELSRLPGIGPKTAQRLAFHLLRVDRVRADSLAKAIEDVKARIGYCERCYNIAEGSLCWICASPRRDASVLCVVESAFDVLAIERTSEFSGLYFVLHGVISPIDGVGPEQIHVPQLLERVREEAVGEVIIATDADIEGEATAVYLQRALQPLVATVTRPAHGLPVGGDLEYADELTLAKAMAGRRAF